MSDMRKLDHCLQREPYPLPVIDDILWKVNGFKFATCLDLNRGYYHFKLDKPSQRICTIVLPWGKYSYTRLPQGLMPSSDILQSFMSDIFHDFSDVLVYIDNILLFTKQDFDHHIERLHQVLIILQQHNMHTVYM